MEDRGGQPAGEDVLGDLFLAFACSRGDTPAIQHFDRAFAPVIDNVRRRFGARAPAADELRADLHHRLFVPREGAPPRILEYGGESELVAWLRVVVTRLLLNRLAATIAEDPSEDRVLEGMQLTWETPEHMFDREEARAYFKDAFRRAVRSLAARDRTILRLVFAEGLTIDDLGLLYHVHRTTAFRRVRQANDRLSSALRRIVREEKRMTDEEYERWCESLRSGLEISVERLLETSEPGT